MMLEVVERLSPVLSPFGLVVIRGIRGLAPNGRVEAVGN
jgi:hypothetical protein